MIVQEIRNLLGLLINYSYDAIRYWKYAFNSRRYGPCVEAHIVARIQMNAHSIEKGLSLASPKMGFGKAVVEELVDLLSESKSRGIAQDHVAVRSALGALKGYLLFHQEHSYDIGLLKQRIECMVGSYDAPLTEPVVHLHRDDILKAARGDFAMVVTSRHSVRQFTSKPVDVTLLLNAVCLAQNSPSVCNRQCARAYICVDRSRIARLAQLQKGSRGFGEVAPCFIIVTSDLTKFATSAERNQAYIDGGLFAMSLMYALHYYGLASCPLNWCKNLVEDRQLRREFDISASETVIMMLAVGHMPDEFNVARSSREQIEKIVRMLI